MDGNLHKTRERNPSENAGIFSKILFIFTLGTIRKGYRNDLKSRDIYEVVNRQRAQDLGDTLEKFWNKELCKPRPCIITALLKIFWIEYITLGIGILFFETSIQALQPLLMGRVVAYFETGQTEISRASATWYGIGLITCITVFKIYDHNYVFGVAQLGLRIRIACCSLLYRKCLMLNLSTSPEYETGKLVTIMTKDVTKFEGAADAVHVLCESLLQMFVLTYLMYRQIGISAIFGFAFLLSLVILHVYLGTLIKRFRLKTAKHTDERVRTSQEILTAIRTIKMYTWELLFAKNVSNLRTKEIQNLRIMFYVKALALAIGQLSGMVALYICIMSYIALGHHITAEKAFVVIGCFEGLRSVLAEHVPVGIERIAEVSASIKRITNFLLLEEVQEKTTLHVINKPTEPRILIKDLSVELKSGMCALKCVNLDLRPGITLLTGEVGSGKSTIITSILGDTKTNAGSIEVSGTAAYASQEPWIFPGTLRQNIVFSELFDDKRYATIIDICALNKDLDSFPYGDQTCLTDHGLNMSRGQKARINLARAIYKKADIYLLDDCLSSVDTRVARHIFYECIVGFLKNCICILATHEAGFFQEAETIVVLNNGRIEFKGNHLKFKEFAPQMFRGPNHKTGIHAREKYLTTLNGQTSNEDNQSGEHSKLLIAEDSNIYDETKQEGSVKWKVYYTYFTSGGGLKIFILVIVLAIITQISTSLSEIFVSSWVDLEQDLSMSRYNVTKNSTQLEILEEQRGSAIIQYTLAIIAAVVFTLLRVFVYFIFSSNASKKLHNMAFERILNAGIKFFDVNLAGNVINRFSRDFEIIDEQAPFVIFGCLQTILMLFAALFVVSTVNAIFLIPSALFVAILYYAQRLYLPVGRSIRRLQGVTRSPVVGYLTTTLEGLTTIRAGQAQAILKKEFDRHQDLHSSVSYMNLTTSTAFAFYLDAISTFYMATIIITFLFIKVDTLAGKVGLAITQSFSLTGLLKHGIREWTTLETQMTSTERILEYSKTKLEDKSGCRLLNWPTNGTITYDNVNLQYSSNSELVLKDISFVIAPREKIGVVGRTGAGKTSIIASLFRLYEYSGTIRIDDIDANTLQVEFLRSKISIIPQDPVLFSGSIRDNLDPNRNHTDAEIWNALEQVDINNLIKSLEADNETNLSIGQRQLLCLARAILTNNIILVLDEVTANVDPQTDVLIQKTLQRNFSECTVITISHRLQTILDMNKVLVLDSGRVIQFDSPKVLLDSKIGLFYEMVREAGLVE